MVVFVMFAEAFQLTVLLPFIPFMVAEFPGVTEDRVGFYSGLVTAAFPFGQLCSSILIGKIADRFGAKRVVLISQTMTCTCTVVFGFSTSLVMAVLTRLAAGLCNGNTGVVKSYLGMVTDASNQGQAMALLSAAFALGSIIAPAIGGFLSSPAEHYPGLVAPGSLLDHHEYLLPCLVAAACVAASIVCVAVFMRDASQVLLEIAEQRRRRDESLAAGLPPPPEGPMEHLAAAWHRLRGRWAQRRPPVKAPRASGAYGRIDGDDYDADGDAEDFPTDRTDGDGAQEDAASVTEVALHAVSDGDDEPAASGAPAAGERAAMLADLSRASMASINPDGTTTAEPLRYKPPRLRDILFATTMYGFVALFFAFLDDIYPLYCRAVYAQGGLEFTTNDIGITLSFLGGVSIVYNLFVYPRVSRRVGLMRLYRVSLVIAAPMCLLYPTINVLGARFGRPAIWPLLMANLIVRGIVGLQMFTTVMVYVNNSVPRERMGFANGIGQSFAAGVRAFGPTLAGGIWSALAPATFPGHQFIIYVVACVMLGAQYLLSFRYPPSIQKPFVKVPLDDEEADLGIEMSGKVALLGGGSDIEATDATPQWSDMTTPGESSVETHSEASNAHDALALSEDLYS